MKTIGKCEKCGDNLTNGHVCPDVKRVHVDRVVSQAVPQGVVAVLVAEDGREIANATDFNCGSPGGFTQQEAQRLRAERMLAMKTMREVTKRCNNRNASLRKDNTSGVKGVSYIKRESKWRAYINIDGVKKFIGVSKTLCEAALLRLAAEQCIGWKGCENNSSAYLYYVKHVKSLVTHSVTKGK